MCPGVVGCSPPVVSWRSIAADMEGGPGAVIGMKVYSCEEGAKATSLVAARALSLASLCHASASKVACHQSITFCIQALRSCQAHSV